MITLAMRYRLQRFIYLRVQGLCKGDKHHAYAVVGFEVICPIFNYVAIASNCDACVNSFTRRRRREMRISNRDDLLRQTVALIEQKNQIIATNCMQSQNSEVLKYNNNKTSVKTTAIPEVERHDSINPTVVANSDSPTGMHFPAILSNYNGTTACICRRFIPPTAILVSLSFC